MEHRDSQIRRKFSKRKPLVDVSNTVVSSTSSTYPRKLREETEAKRNPRSVVVHDSGPASSIGSCQSSKVSTRKVDPPLSSGVHGDGAFETVIPCTDQRAKRLKKKQKGKEKVDMEASSFSCPPAKRIRNSGENQMKISEDDGNRKGTSSVPHPMPKRKWRYILAVDDERQPQTVIPQQFIEEQKAYFAEVDAFDLIEELVSEADLE